MILATLRKLRHGPLRILGPFWLVCGHVFRKIMSRSGLYVSHSIGDCGPFRLDVRFAFSNFSRWGADRHNDGFAACIDACRGKQCVFDIGAHIGLVSLPMASVVGPGGKVVSFEPGRANRDFLSRHASRNGFHDRIIVEDTLVGDCSRENVPFYESDQPSGMNSTVKTAKTATRGSDYGYTSRQQISLDDYCTRNKLLPEVIKIDVEGAEIDVLKGAAETMKNARPVVFLSFHPRHVSEKGLSADDLTDLLREYNYRWTCVDGTEVEAFALREYILEPGAS